MSEPLVKLAVETRGDSRRTSGFLHRLAEIVERYQIMLDIDDQNLPELTDSEIDIMGEAIAGGVIDANSLTIDDIFILLENREKLLIEHANGRYEVYDTLLGESDEFEDYEELKEYALGLVG